MGRRSKLEGISCCATARPATTTRTALAHLPLPESPDTIVPILAFSTPLLPSQPPSQLAFSLSLSLFHSSRSLSLSRSLVPPTRCRERSPRDACELKIPRLASPVPRISIRFYANVLALAICSFNKRSLNRARFGITLFPV